MLKNLLLLAGFSTFVVIVIIGYDVYQNLGHSSLQTTTQKHVTSIVPNFDRATLNELKKHANIPVNLEEKSKVVSEDSSQAVTTGIPTPTNTQTQNNSTSSATSTFGAPASPIIP